MADGSCKAARLIAHRAQPLHSSWTPANRLAHSRPPPKTCANGQSLGNRNLAIFDFDGTIADSAAWFGNALNELAQHNGFREVSAEQREMLRGRSTREIFAYLGIPSWKLPLVVRQLREIAARDVEQISIFPWVPDVLAALRSRGISIAIVSSNTRPIFAACLAPRWRR